MTRLIAFGLMAILISCAPTRDPFGLALLHGHEPSAAAPESLRVDVDIALRQKGAPPFSARLYAEPYRRYRLDAFGFPPRIVASYLWTGGRWTLLLDESREIFRGEGDSLSLDIEGLSLRLPDMHALLGSLWGDPLPGFGKRDLSTLTWNGDTLRWRSEGVRWEALFDTSSGICLEARSPTFALQYRNPQRHGTRIIPREIEVFVNGESILVLRVDQIEDHPFWKKDPFSLPVSGNRVLPDTGLPHPDTGSSKNEGER